MAEHNLTAAGRITACYILWCSLEVIYIALNRVLWQLHNWVFAQVDSRIIKYVVCTALYAASPRTRRRLDARPSTVDELDALISSALYCTLLYQQRGGERRCQTFSFCSLFLFRRTSDSRLIWFGSVYLVTTAGFVADQLMWENNNNNNNRGWPPCKSSVVAFSGWQPILWMYETKRFDIFFPWLGDAQKVYRCVQLFLWTTVSVYM